MIRKLIARLKRVCSRRSSGSYVAHLRAIGVHVGEGTCIQEPRTTLIDETRPSLVTIGENCFINGYFELLTHDWVSHVFLHSGRMLVNSSGRVTIGNNVAFGRHVTVLKNVRIGDNCFIGAHSVVTRDIPADSIAVGAPARVVKSLEEYYQRRLSQGEAEALDYARSIQERFGRRPVPADFREEFYLFVDGADVERYPEIPIRFQLGPMYGEYVNSHRAKYRSFDVFLQAAGIS